jgi:hypothetical protein
MVSLMVFFAIAKASNLLANAEQDCALKYSKSTATIARCVNVALYTAIQSANKVDFKFTP